MDRADQLTAAEREAERGRLEHEIAVSVASQRARLFFALKGRHHIAGWITINQSRASPDEADALRYLDLCGLLERREGEPDVVRIKDNVANYGLGQNDGERDGR